MVKELNYKKLRKELIELLEGYLKNPRKTRNRNKLIKLWKYYFNAFPFMKKVFREALDIGEDFICFNDPSKIKIQRIIKELKITKL